MKTKPLSTLDALKIDNGFMPEATAQQIRSAADAEYERARALWTLADRIDAGEFDDPLTGVSAGVLYKGEVIYREDW